MKLKSLAVIALLVLGCSAVFGQSYSFGFLSYDKSTQYCDYEVFSVFAPYAWGTHNLTTGCGLEVDGAMVGFKNAIPTYAAVPVSGAIVELADNTFDAETLLYTGCQIDWETKTKTYKQVQYGWEFFFNCGGISDYLGNYGYLTTELGAGGSNNANATKTSFGAARANAKNNPKNKLLQ